MFLRANNSACLIIPLQHWYESNMLAGIAGIMYAIFSLGVHLCFVFFCLPSFVVPVFEEHPDISQGVPRQVWPAQQWAVWPFWPLRRQGLRQGELNIRLMMDALLFSLQKTLCTWTDTVICSKNDTAHRLHSGYSTACSNLETCRCLCPW